MIVICKYLPEPYVSMAVWPFILVKEECVKNDIYIINHEKIHLRQQLELLWLPFFIAYALEFVIRLLLLRNWNKAYHAISFEKEAYQHETNLEYLKNKPLWSFFKFI